MRRLIPWLIVVAVLVVAYVTKPDDKTCIITAVNAVWGKRVPDVYSKPKFYEAFMNITSKKVIVDDWIFLKRVRYKLPDKELNIAIGAFNHVFTNN